MDWLRRLIEAILRWVREWLRRRQPEAPPPPSPDHRPDHRPLGEGEVPRHDVPLNDEGPLSPPIVAEPLYRCASAVTVLGFVPHAEIDVEVAGAVVLTRVAGFSDPDGETFPLPAPLESMQVVRARQRVGARTSDWSAPVTVRSHLEDYPAGLPRPQVNPAPVHQCGSRTGVSNLLIGCNVWITAETTEVGRVDGAAAHQGVNVAPDYGLGQSVRAHAELCSDPSPPSEKHITQPPPVPLATPVVADVYDGGERIRITSLANGARFTVKRGGIDQGTWSTWGQAHLVGFSPPLVMSEGIEVSQRLCPGTDTPGGTTTVLPCSQLPAPNIAPVQVGDTRVRVTEHAPGALIRIYLNGSKVGEGGPPLIQLTRAVAHGDTVHVLQSVGRCVGSTLREVRVRCVAPPLGADPAGVDLFPVGHGTYDGGTFPFMGRTFSLKGTVFYPAREDGANTPFNTRRAEAGRAPVVFMAHGNHGRFRDADDPFNEATGEENQFCSPGAGRVEIPNHEGYDYLQRALARMGFVAVSVYTNETNCVGITAQNIRERAELIIQSIRHFQGLDTGGDPRFGGRLDLSRVGLLGHSRGGEAVVLVPEVIALAGVTVRAVLSLAPTDAGASTGRPRGLAFMTILPAGDGDVVSNDGAKYYDQAEAAPFKCQVYAHRTNHNYFNRQWLEDDGLGPPVMSRHQHERILLAYGCAFYRAALAGHATTAFLSGRTLPPDVPAGDVHLSFERDGSQTVDHHDEANGIGTNSLGKPTSQSGGLTADEFVFRRSAAGSFNATFFGNTRGMVAQSREASGQFRSQLDDPQDLRGREVWVRAAEVYNGTSVPAGATGFQLGLEDAAGVVAWVDSDGVGGLPRPYDRRADDLMAVGSDFTKTMLKTLRFPVACFRDADGRFDPSRVRAVLFRLNRMDQRALALDVLQIVSA